jgi:CO dehydrogenase maturation factor
MLQIALAGKGSSGKSSLTPFLIQHLVSRHRRLLVVDADPHMTATRFLSLSADVTLGSLRSQYERQFKSGAGLPSDETRDEFAERAMGEQALIHCQGYDFLAMGRWEPDGSQCTVNRVLGRAMTALAAKYDLVLVDNEAGLEHIGRFTAPIDLLLIVATPDPLFLDVAQQIWQRCREVNRLVQYAFLVLNRVDDDEDTANLRHQLIQTGIPWVDPYLPESKTLRRISRSGGNPSSLPVDDPWRLAAERVIDATLSFII